MSEGPRVNGSGFWVTESLLGGGQVGSLVVAMTYVSVRSWEASEEDMVKRGDWRESEAA